MLKERIGHITHYFDRIKVAVLELDDSLSTGETVLFEKDNQGFAQSIMSMQVDKKPIKTATKGMEVGVKVEAPVKPGFEVYRVK